MAYTTYFQQRAETYLSEKESKVKKLVRGYPRLRFYIKPIIK